MLQAESCIKRYKDTFTAIGSNVAIWLDNLDLEVDIRKTSH